MQLIKPLFNTQHNWLTDLLWLTMALCFFYAIWMGAHPLFTPDEGRYSEIAREMIVTGDYITPRLNGVVFFDKPILYYWLQASAIKMFGLNEWALRFWPALFGVLGCLATYITGRLLFNRRSGILSAIILATCPVYYGAAHYANLDLEVAVLISNSLLLFLIALHATSSLPRNISLFMAYVFMGLAFLTKGLIGIVFPAMIICTWIVLLNRWNMLKKLRLFSGLCIFAVTALPWYILVQKINPEFFQFFFVKQQISRFLTTESFNNQTPLWFYIPVVLIGIFPWCIFVIQAIKQHLNFKTLWKNRQNTSIELFLLLWLILIFIFFSIPKSKTIGYILPIFPAIALFIGNYLNQSWDIIPKRTPHIFLGLTITASILLLAISASSNMINTTTIKPLALQIKPLLHLNDEIVAYNRYYQDLPIYLERRITIVTDWNDPDIERNDNWKRELWYGISSQNTKEWLIDETTFWQRWNSNKRLFVFTSENSYNEWEKKSKVKTYKIAQHEKTILLSNMSPTVAS